MRHSQLSDPFLATRVFLSHSWEDNQLTDYAFREVDRQFTAIYDRAAELGGSPRSSGLLPGDSLVPAELISSSDVFVFFASESSMPEGSRPFQEFQIARGLSPGLQLIVARLESYSMPRHYATGVYLNMRYRSRKRDTERLATSIRKLAAKNAGLIELSGRKSRVLAGQNHGHIIELLSDRHDRTLLPINAVIPHLEMNKLAELVVSADNDTRDRILERLVEIYVSYDHDADLIVARQNAVILAGKIAGDGPSLAKEFRKRYPDHDYPFLFRGFHVAMGFLGDGDLATEYAVDLAERPGVEWDSQRELNLKFHVDYYGGVPAALDRLRSSIKALAPVSLLSLNVHTLGELSDIRRDVELLESRRVELLSLGVPDTILSNAIRRIDRRFKAKKKASLK